MGDDGAKCGIIVMAKGDAARGQVFVDVVLSPPAEAADQAARTVDRKSSTSLRSLTVSRTRPLEADSTPDAALPVWPTVWATPAMLLLTSAV